MDAAIFAETDYMRAVSENVIVGQMAPVGTGVFDLYMDDTRAGEDLVCPLDFATPTLPYMKGQTSFLSGASPFGGNATPLPQQTPDTPGTTFVRTDSPGEDLKTPVDTPGDDDDQQMGRSAGASPFSPFSQPGSVNQSVRSDTSPAYTPADADSPPGTSPGYSPAYTPSRPEDQTSSPSYHSFNDRTSPAYTSPHYRQNFSPTSVSPADHTSPRGYQTTPGTSPVYSPMDYAPPARAAPRGGRAGREELYAPTSPEDTSIHAGLTSPQVNQVDQRGQPGSPIYNPVPTSPIGESAPTSPSYTPQPGARAMSMPAAEEAEPAGDLQTFDGSDDEDTSMFDDGADQETDY